MLTRIVAVVERHALSPEIVQEMLAALDADGVAPGGQPA
jgi:hypothetical protein